VFTNSFFQKSLPVDLYTIDIMENANPQEDRAALAKAAMLRRQGAKKGGKAKSEAVLCAEREAAKKGKSKGKAGNKSEGQALTKGGLRNEF
jgi:hypothetical protein